MIPSYSSQAIPSRHDETREEEKDRYCAASLSAAQLDKREGIFVLTIRNFQENMKEINLKKKKAGLVLVYLAQYVLLSAFPRQKKPAHYFLSLSLFIFYYIFFSDYFTFTLFISSWLQWCCIVCVCKDSSTFSPNS